AAYVLLERSTVGRALYAIGFSRAGARYAGLPVPRRLLLVYVISGASAALAAMVYVSHIGQARSDVGNGYELGAITAVVLGGAAGTGGRGSMAGTLLGVFVLAVLPDGLQLAALPSELVGVLAGGVRVGAIALDRWRGVGSGRSAIRVVERLESGGRGTLNGGPAAIDDKPSGEVPVKNSQVAVLCTAVIAGALIVAGTNAWLFSAITRGGAGATAGPDRKSTRLNSSHVKISYAVFCVKKKKIISE